MSNPLSPISSSLPSYSEKKVEPMGRGDSRWQLRLVISVPALLILVILVYGLVSYFSFLAHWDELERVGAGAVAGVLLRTQMIAMIILVIVAMLVGLGLCYSILRPIRKLVETARLVAGGRLDQRVPQLPAARELDDLSRSFNAMIDNLNRSISERNRCLMEGIPIGVMTTDLDGRVGAISPLAADMLGIAADQLVGHRIAELREILLKPSQVLVETLLSLAKDGQPQSSVEITLNNPNGEQRLTVSSSVLRDSSEQVYGLVFSFRETTRIQGLSMLSRTDQLAALGTFTLGLAHELRNPLGAIKGLSQLLLLEAGLPPRAGDFLVRMTQEVDRVDAFLRQLFELSEQPIACLMPTSLANVLQKANELARQEAAQEKVNAINLECILEPMPLLMLEGDRLIIAFAKIIQNAYEAAPLGGTITLWARREQNGGAPAYIVEIRNSGSTIEPENRKKIFDPFFTTKDKVTGLGLTIANQIIIQNGGRLDLAVQADEVSFVTVFESLRVAGAGLARVGQGGGA